MRTTNFNVVNYCVACRARCRYCLLSSCNRATGVEYARGKRFARRVLEELRETWPDIAANYYIGYCMDTPYLEDLLAFSREMNLPAARFLQMNGFGVRKEEEWASLMHMIKAAGVEMLDLTFFGSPQFHDAFAGRIGDFAICEAMLRAAVAADLAVNVSIPLLRDNLTQLSELMNRLEGDGAKRLHFFSLSEKGRGAKIIDQKITQEELEALPDSVRAWLMKTPLRSEAQWIAAGEWSEPVGRSLGLVLTPSEMELFEKMSAGELLAFVEEKDDRFRASLPPVRELVALYGQPENTQLYRYRDLIHRWEQRYATEHGLYDMNDESHHFSNPIY